MTTLAPDTPLRLTMEDEVLDTTWASFVTDNDLDNEREWQAEIIRALETHNVYYGGGGAQPWYHLAFSPHSCSEKTDE